MTKGRLQQAIDFSIYCDDILVEHYRGDGVIVATPTGSTAYSMAAGGPILDSQTKGVVVTPICPQSLANRPLVVDASNRIIFESPKQRDELSLLVDGQLVAVISETVRIHLRRADFNLPLVSMTNQDFYDVLHQKMGWTGTSIGGEGKG